MSDPFILWDFDGTLAYREGMWSGTLLETLERFEPSLACDIDQFKPHLQDGFPWHRHQQEHTQIAAEDWWEWVTPVFARAFEAVGMSSVRADELAKRVRGVYLEGDRWRVFNDVIPVLESLQAKGWKHAILSNHVPELEELVSTFGIRRYFSAVFSSACVGYEKPHPAFFAHALEALERPRTAWMVGDNLLADVHGAMSVNLPAVLVRSERQDAVFHCHSLTELPALIGAQLEDCLDRTH